MRPTNYTSIVIASYVSDDLRAKMFRTSIETLIATTRDLPVEIIIVDNGGSFEITQWLDAITLNGEIQCLIKNANNMHFGFGRNQGIAMAHGEYLCIADNDIYYKEGWLQSCLKVLQEYPLRKLWATPIDYPKGLNDRRTIRYDAGELEVGDDVYKLSMRAGSNCFVIRRDQFDEVGRFKNHRIAGSVWNDDACKKGYLGAVTPEPLVLDLGLRVGYNHKQPLPVRRTLRNSEEIYFNEDEYKIPN